MLTLLEITVMVTIRQTDSEAIASDAATASISPGQAAGTARSLNPAARVDRIMDSIPFRAFSSEVDAGWREETRQSKKLERQFWFSANRDHALGARESPSRQAIASQK